MHNDKRLIEYGFPCHQVGAETQRERGASSALPPLYYMHVWWARRPLTPSRAAIIASLAKRDMEPDRFVRMLGIEKKQAIINDVPWTLTGELLEMVEQENNKLFLEIDKKVYDRLLKEVERRNEVRKLIESLVAGDKSFADESVVQNWLTDNRPFGGSLPHVGDTVIVIRIKADPAAVNERIEFAKRNDVKKILGFTIKFDQEDLYGYSRAFYNNPDYKQTGFTVLDPTSGGGSIPFEALRLGHNIIANELNPVAATILYATLDYPARYGIKLVDEIKKFGGMLLKKVESTMEPFYPFSKLPESEIKILKEKLKNNPAIFDEFDVPEYDQMGLIFCRQVTCPHCGGDAPLLNTCWLSKEESDLWGVRIITENKKIRFETYRVKNGKGPNGEEPDYATVSDGLGNCVHCHQAIAGDEIKAQARGESRYGKWRDILYAVVAVRHEPDVDKNGNVLYYKSGEKKGQVKTKKVRFFRAPNQFDLDALDRAEDELKKRWDYFEGKGLIPTEKFPEGNDNRPMIYGMPRWCDMFTSRQLLGHLILIDELNNMKSKIIADLGSEKARAVITYLQFVIDKGLTYNGKQTMWHCTRGVIAQAFTRHDFSLKWTFAEMIFSGPNSGTVWGLSQVIDAYNGHCELLSEVNEKTNGNPPVRIINGTGAHIAAVEKGSVDLVCMDPPYYDNVQYAELSDYFYVWQKRTLFDVYPELFKRNLTNKADEAVANPARDGSRDNAKKAYENMMREIFSECNRVLKSEGMLTIMFTHKSQDAWETLTRSIIESGWIITSSFPVESEATTCIHQKDIAAAASSIFITCRKRVHNQEYPAVWVGLGGSGVREQIKDAVLHGLSDFQRLKLNPVDEMVASYGKALQVLSENWPVIDETDEAISPIRAMNEASRIVAQNQITRLTGGALDFESLSSECGMALTLFGIYGLNELSYDEALNISRSLNIALETKNGGYTVGDKSVGINAQVSARKGSSASLEEKGYYAPVIKKGSTLRIALPEERNANRLEAPQTEWDVLCGLIMAYRRGDIPVARAYIEKHANNDKKKIFELLKVWQFECGDEKLYQEAAAILYSLKSINRDSVQVTMFND